ncbi:MAG: hypothetical protein ACN4EP_15125 [Sediminibacterium sp.]
MENAMNANGETLKMLLLKAPAGDKPYKDNDTVHQLLNWWYHILKLAEPALDKQTLFSGLEADEMYLELKRDIDMIPSLLMNEMIYEPSIPDKEQYIRLIQALLVNCSDTLFTSSVKINSPCDAIENTLLFIRNFFYQYFDFDYRVTMYCMEQFNYSFKLKLDYWKVKLKQSSLIESLKNCISEKMILPNSYFTFRKISYLEHLFHLIEAATTVITEEYVRDLLITHNFNAACFIDYETNHIKESLKNEASIDESITLLQNELANINLLKDKHNISFDIDMPGIKKQLHDWVIAEMKQLKSEANQIMKKDLVIDPDSKIQTSLSVAKLAAIIRLLVADKIIINKSIAPMLRTVSKLFTTLQKDEVSFGSLETKYHAPDKATLNIMKEMLQKWVGVIQKL